MSLSRKVFTSSFSTITFSCGLTVTGNCSRIAENAFFCSCWIPRARRVGNENSNAPVTITIDSIHTPSFMFLQYTLRNYETLREVNQSRSEEHTSELQS